MKQVRIMVLSKRKIKRNLFIILFSFIGLYLLISLYFINHFLFRTEINGVNVSLKAHRNFSNIISKYIREYDILIIERSGETEVITGHEIGMKYNNGISLHRIWCIQNPFMWLSSLFKSSKFYIKDLFIYNAELLDIRINRLNCLNREIINPRNVDFKYINGSYEIIKEIDGNKINKFYLKKALIKYISEGKRILDLDKMNCYEKPKYTASSKKTIKTKNLLDKYVSAKITYRFGKDTETLDAASIHKWLKVDENLDVIINNNDVAAYVRELSKKYDTVGIKRTFLTSTGKIAELQGGLYGWKIDRNAETEALINHIKKGDKIEKEPAYLQKAVSRYGNEIGDTYIEINITKQHLWFYKDGKMIVQGPVVTGNPNRGHATVLGVYMINYKQMNATLTGPGYEAKVTYWMPFFGNIGLHDAPWRYRFGGDIYLRNGSHGCVNAPLYLAKTVFENIEEGTPVVVYEE
ncbi:putative peptidoglycan binding protein [Herbinix hemicellulosilytica]|uniref:L,D-TPase catalytic domain-containing protein n=1 Tax=Herbinix hemicellulosilytica TaxID=1564487 RepID=A0A0H5SED4_HERHM|nr:L,D-transpeptidase family protein [Herbinix hemicellulosilytica]RBP57758.1 putative peptidoglycan binding protein [Herbinix hemicellulosilytica]CRZ33410.1 hypothetical protein HHT355_0196 [Herbinix hemicellulosilytica]